MSALSSKPWITSVAISGLAIASCLIASPAQSAQPCPSSSLFKDIFGPTFQLQYVCDLGSITYTFNFGKTLGELATGAENEATLYLTDTPDYQIIEYGNLKQKTKSSIIFETRFVSPVVYVYPYFSSVQATIGANPAPYKVDLLWSPPYDEKNPNPIPPSLNTNNFFTSYEVKRPTPNPLPTLTSLTSRIAKVPGPLPIAGAAVTFGFSRKLRRRIKAVS